MAHFAELDSNNKVISVIVVSNDEMVDENGNEVEQMGIDYIHNILKKPNRWVQTSYNNSFRVRYAGAGYTYDENLDAFIEPKPYPSWVLNNSTADWEAPIPKPDNDNLYQWNEQTQNWDLIS